MEPDAEFSSATSANNGSGLFSQVSSEVSAVVPEPSGLAEQSGAAEQSGVPEPADYAREFSEYAKAARGTAIKSHTKGDQFGEKLANQRATVYDQAAELARQYPPQVAANAMMEQAKANHVRTPPLVNFDQAGMQYVAAMAWQYCAWQIDSELPEAAPSWD